MDQSSPPLKKLDTELTWDDLVLLPDTLDRIHETENWIKSRDSILKDWDLESKLKTGYRALFYGPNGTGKTLTASLLGKYTYRDVYKIDLSMIVSKYIGKTEKNLSRLFDQAGNKDWILFFDEADALFEKRTDITDAHDRYANQKVSYLLQLMETFNGISILSAGNKANIDQAFIRRLNTVIYFPMPDSSRE